MSLKFFIWLVRLDEVTLGFGYGFVLEKVSVEYRHLCSLSFLRPRLLQIPVNLIVPS